MTRAELAQKLGISTKTLSRRLNTVDEVFCTHTFSTGECSRTANTCAAAQAAFYDCACNSGYSHFCAEE